MSRALHAQDRASLGRVLRSPSGSEPRLPPAPPGVTVVVSVIVSAITDSSCLWQGSWQGVGTGGAGRCSRGRGAAGRVRTWLQAQHPRLGGRLGQPGGVAAALGLVAQGPSCTAPPRGIGGWVGDTDGHRPQRCPGVGTRSVPMGPALRPRLVGCRIRKAPHPLPDTGTPDAAVCPPFPEAPVCVSSSGPHPGPHQTRTDGLVGSLPSVSA